MLITPSGTGNGVGTGVAVAVGVDVAVDVLVDVGLGDAGFDVSEDAGVCRTLGTEVCVGVLLAVAPPPHAERMDPIAVNEMTRSGILFII